MEMACVIIFIVSNFFATSNARNTITFYFYAEPFWFIVRKCELLNASGESTSTFQYLQLLLFDLGSVVVCKPQKALVWDLISSIGRFLSSST